MPKKVKKQKSLDKNCLSLVKAVLNEDAVSANKLLKQMVRKNIARKLSKAERETQLF